MLANFLPNLDRFGPLLQSLGFIRHFGPIDHNSFFSCTIFDQYSEFVFDFESCRFVLKFPHGTCVRNFIVIAVADNAKENFRFEQMFELDQENVGVVVEVALAFKINQYMVANDMKPCKKVAAFLAEQGFVFDEPVPRRSRQQRFYERAADESSVLTQ